MKTRNLLINLIGHNNFDYELCNAGGVYIRSIDGMRRQFPHGGTLELNGYTYFVWEK